MKRLILSLIVVLILPVSAQIYLVEGAEILQSGVSPASLGFAGIHAAEDEQLDNLQLNPVVSARLIRPAVNIAWAGFSQLNGVSAVYAQPTPIGVFSLGYTGVFAPELELGQYNRMSLGFAKEISLRWKFGFNVNADFGKFGESNTNISSKIPKNSPSCGGGSLTLGFHYNEGRAPKVGFDIGNFRYGLIVRNLGFNPEYKNLKHNGEQTVIQPFTLNTGMSFDFLRLGGKKVDNDWGMAFDLNMNLLPFNIQFNVGPTLALKFHKGFLEQMVGTIGFNTIRKSKEDNFGTVNLGPVTFGGRLRFRIGKSSLDVNAAVAPEQVGDKDGVFFGASMNLSIGRKDRSAPELNLGDFSGSDLIPSEVK